MKKYVNVTVGCNPNYSSPQAPELFFEIALSGESPKPDSLGRTVRSVAVMKRASYKSMPGAASVLAWDKAVIKIPRLKHDVSVEGMEVWHELVAVAHQAQALAVRLDQVYEPDMAVVLGEIAIGTLREIVQANHKIKVEAPHFVSNIPGGMTFAERSSAMADVFAMLRSIPGEPKPDCASCEQKESCLGNVTAKAK